MWTWGFWRGAGERAVRTVAQVAAAMLTADAVSLLDADWIGVASVAGMAGVVSLLTSVATGSATGTPGITESPDL